MLQWCQWWYKCFICTEILIKFKKAKLFPKEVVEVSVNSEYYNLGSTTYVALHGLSDKVTQPLANSGFLG